MGTRWKSSAVPYTLIIMAYYFLATALFAAADIASTQSFWLGIRQMSWTTYADTLYYASIKERLAKEAFLGAFSLLAGICFLWSQRKAARPPGLRFGWLLRLPMDARTALCAGLGFALLRLPFSYFIFYFPIGMSQLALVSLEALLIAAFFRLSGSLLHLLKGGEQLRAEWHRSLIMRHLRLVGYALSDMKLFLFSLFLLGATAFTGILAAIFATSYVMQGFATACLLIYMLTVAPLLLEWLGALNMIREASRKAAGGDLFQMLAKRGIGWPFRDLADAINNMKAGYRKALEEQVKSERLKTELITNVSHDLKTPLTSIVNYVDLLQAEGLTPEERDKYLHVLTRKTERLKLLIDDLFEASKMASGAVDLTIERVDVAALLEQAMAELGDKIAASRLTFRIKGARPGMYARLDGRKTWRVFENLIGNALKYSLPDTRVHVLLEETNSHIHFSIFNVSAYEIDFEVEELMERFKRGDASRSTEGSGLGLAIARSIVELQGGDFRIELEGDMFKVMIRFPK